MLRPKCIRRISTAFITLRDRIRITMKTVKCGLGCLTGRPKAKRSALFILIVLLAFLTEHNILAQQSHTTAKCYNAPPKIASPSAVAIDTRNGRIMYDKNAFKKRQMASTAKIMTAILAIEKGDRNDLVTVSRRAAYIGGSQAHLKVGEKIKLGHLLYALMLPSGNDAAIAIAEHTSGSVEQFVLLMDQKAKEIGAHNTKYGSPHGLDRNNYSTAYDLALITRYCLENPTFKELVRTKNKVIPRQGSTAGKEYRNTNKLLFTYGGADGVKTGYTSPAGKCLVASATKNDWQVVSVVLGAKSTYQRFNDSAKILDYVFDNFPFVTVLPKGRKMVSVSVLKGKKDSVYLINRDEITMHLSDAELAEIERDFLIPDQLTAPVVQDQAVGKVILRLGENIIGACDLYAAESVRFWTVDMNLRKIFENWIQMNKMLQKHMNL